MATLPIANNDTEAQGILSELPLLPGLLGFAGKFIPRDQARDLYERLRSAPQGFRLKGSALELGRSFVRPEYERQCAPLLQLWKGIARFVALHPETPVLFGAVSISNEYSSLSREMIVRYFEQRQEKR